MQKILNYLLMTATVCGISLAAASCSSNDDNPATPDLNLSEKIIGKWVPAGLDGRLASTNQKMVTTFVSTTKAIASSSKVDFSETDNKWNVYREDDVKIEGNKVTLTGHPNEHTTLINEYIVSTINDAELVGKWRHITIVDGVETVNTENDIRLVKVNVDYRADIVGTWQGRCTSEGSVFDDGQEHRWEYKADGTYVYYVKDGNNWVPYATNTLNEYFVDGNLLCTRWIDNGVENREWWEITITDGKMNWTALRENSDRTTFTATFEMERVE